MSVRVSAQPLGWPGLNGHCLEVGCVPKVHKSPADLGRRRLGRCQGRRPAPCPQPPPAECQAQTPPAHRRSTRQRTGPGNCRLASQTLHGQHTTPAPFSELLGADERQLLADLPQALTLDDAVAPSIQVLAVRQVCTTRHHQAGTMLRPAATQQLSGRQSVNLRAAEGRQAGR